ncbi:hypothetical protein M8864_05500 [Pseudomonas aeruginosa]|uniref:hypothetical protein n=1 Tax=Pseudomonas aeruginosa TaxID=287 RepID=UPI002020A513|nr:hypothetical protein [Pseudomonas aeruginosa]MCL8042141.1 hypothetical protein [Pseudomonas aeruginosa]
MTESKICTCPSGDGSLRWPCPAHPEQQVAVAAKLTFINGRPAMCGCQVEYSDGGGEYSDVIYVTLCAKHSGSAILDLVATNRIALTPEYEGQWHADLYLDREIPLAKVEGATPAEAVLALMSAERIDPEQESVEQAGGDRWDALQSIMEWTAAENIPDDRKLCLIRNAARAALAQPSPVRSSLLINGYQLRAALDFIAPDGTAEQLESEACIEWRQQDADFLEAGLYAFCAEYPEEGGVLLDEEPTTAQPSPLQSEQAEAERPEVVAWQYRVTAGSQTGWSLWHHGKGEEFERSYTVERRPLMTVSQHERIVGAVLRQKHEADTALAWATRHYQTVEQQRDAAQDNVDALAVQVLKLGGTISFAHHRTERPTHECTMGVGGGDGNLFVHGDHSSIKAAQKIVMERDAAVARVAELEQKSAGSWTVDTSCGRPILMYEGCSVIEDQTAYEVIRMIKWIGELERQEPVATVAKVPGEDWNSLDFHRDLQHMQPGTKLYAAPVAQAGQVPAAWYYDAPSQAEAAIIDIRGMWGEDDCPTYEDVASALRRLLAAAPGKEGV